MSRERVEFDVLTPDISKSLCIDTCKAKCCDFVLSEHTPEIDIYGYYLLKLNGLEHFVTFYTGYGNPQLLHNIQGKCIFLDPKTSKCLIYPIRPRQCRQYPYNIPTTEKVPEWCELYWASSDQVKARRKVVHQQIDDLFSPQSVSEPIIKEYFKKSEHGRSSINLQVSDIVTIANSTEFWSITIYREEYASEVRNAISKLKTMYSELPWYIVSILYLDDTYSPKYQIQGIWIHERGTVVDYLDTFPPTIQQLNSLLSIVETTKSYFDYYIAGVEAPIGQLLHMDYTMPNTH